MKLEKEEALAEEGSISETVGAVLEGNHSIAYTRAEEALKYIDPNIERDQWVKVGMALKSEFGDDGIDLFNEWSEAGSTYDFNALASTYESIEVTGGITLGTLIWMAQKNPDYAGAKPRTEEEQAAYDADNAERDKRLQEEQATAARVKEEKYVRAAGNAVAMIDVAGDVDLEHKYVVEKKITPYGASMFGRDIYIPMFHEGNLVSVQQIFEDAKSIGPGNPVRKIFTKNGRSKDCYMVIGEIEEEIILCEGWATGCSIHKKTEAPVVVAFTCHNLAGVGRWLQETYPKAVIVIAADNDVAGQKETGKNPGLDAARAAAEKLQCNYVFPDFSTCEFTGSDFNDLLEQGGTMNDAVHIDDFVPDAVDKTLQKKITKLVKRVELDDEKELRRLAEALVKYGNSSFTEKSVSKLEKRGVEGFDAMMDLANDPFNCMSEFEMTEAEMDEYANPEWLYEHLIIQGQITAIMAKPNGGKTTMMIYVAGEMAKAGRKVLYYNADTSIGDAKWMKRYSMETGFRFLLPDIGDAHRGMAGVLNRLEYILQTTKGSLEGYVLIFDTLTKMVDTMNKSASRRLYAYLRAFSIRGASCVLLGHVNKHADNDGKYLYQGVSDLENDIDAMFTLIPEEHEDGSMLITTVPGKSRSASAPLTFHVDANRKVSQLAVAVNATARESLSQGIDKMSDVIDAVDDVLLDGHANQGNVIEACKDEPHRIGTRRVRKALQSYASSTATVYSKEQGHLWRTWRDGKMTMYEPLPRT